MQLNYTTAILLVNKQVRAVKGIYEPDVEGKPPGARHTFKTLDPDLKKGDFVIVPTDTRFKLTVFQITDVDVDVNFDDQSINMKWVTGRIEPAMLALAEETIAKETSAIDMMKRAETERKRRELMATLIQDNPQLAELASVALPSPVTIETKRE